MDYESAKEMYKVNDLCYIKVQPSMFVINGDICYELYVENFDDIKYIRKHWKSKKLVCCSMDFVSGKNKKKCNKCKSFNPVNIYESPCQIRLQLHWNYKNKNYCLELSNTGIRNFLKLQKELEGKYRSMPTQTKIYVTPRGDGRWGEVRFEPCLLP